MQRAFVEKLLAASTFSRQLSAVRETDMLLTRAASLKKAAGGEDDAAAMRVCRLSETLFLKGRFLGACLRHRLGG